LWFRETGFAPVSPHDGIESALEQARVAADGKDVLLWGGAQVVNQYLAAGVLNEIELHLVPVLLGELMRSSSRMVS
jgi:dihydrofolate reductase